MKKVEIISVIKAGDMDKLSIDELIRARNIPELAEYREKIIALTQSKLEEEAQDKKAPNPQPQEEKQLTEEENKQLEENGQHLEELGQNVRLTEESEKAGKNLYAQREDGAEVNVYDEIKSIAKMQVEVNNVDKPEKMTQEEYNRAVETEIRRKPRIPLIKRHRGGRFRG